MSCNTTRQCAHREGIRASQGRATGAIRQTGSSLRAETSMRQSMRGTKARPPDAKLRAPAVERFHRSSRSCYYLASSSRALRRTFQDRGWHSFGTRVRVRVTGIGRFLEGGPGLSSGSTNANAQSPAYPPQKRVRAHILRYVETDTRDSCCRTIWHRRKRGCNNCRHYSYRDNSHRPVRSRAPLILREQAAGRDAEGRPRWPGAPG
jgi:hypothetical protein